ncbi:PolC-type DNA polymerase III [uncultured Methanobrevibacter sp.]|uniref:3'-5' exonuclease n=1 Tax=uncultured Methanobrevibacter sp. TaxID=253161 RepID=UPI00258F44C4|nr:3'-5' exonuclease [uncultured Methanobrevibacter sp.]
MKVIYFDTETTGLDCRRCQIIELAMLTVIDGEIKERYDRFIRVDGPLPPRITEITGITDQMLNGGKTEREVAEDLKVRLTPGTVMIAHNCQFDLQFVYHLLKRHLPMEADEIVESLDWIDTVTVLKDRKEYPHRLENAVEHYGIERVNFHRAIDDTKALYDVTQAMKDERDDLAEYLNVFGYNPKYGVEGRFPFIKYKPQRFNRCMVGPNDILPRK